MPDGLHCRPARFSVDEHQFAGFARQRRGRKPDAPAKGMAGNSMTHQNRLAAIRNAIALGTATIVLSGCLGPTYGTDKTAGEQLFEDLTTSVRMRGEKPPTIAYNPRPGLVRPSDTTLPPPQDNIAEASSEWPESPEERLARIRADADEGKAVSGLAGTTATNGVPQNASQRLGASPRDRGDTPLENLKQNKRAGVVNSEKLAATANPTRRTYLTDPPTEYRQPADTAAYGDLGETEASKERKRRKATAEPSGGWRRLVPWL
jgi:hypothetical protein